MAIVLLCRCQNYGILYKKYHLAKTSIRAAVDVSYDIYGAQPSEGQKNIIVLHGLLGSKKNWKSLSTKIASSKNASVIAADARNHGDSPHDNAHSYLDLADDVSKLQQTLSLSKSHVIGHSMGGRTGMTLALTEPARVQSLIVVDISPIPRRPNPVEGVFPNLVKAMMTVDFAGADSGPKARNIALKTLVAAGYDQAALGFILMSIGQQPDKTFGWKYNLATLSRSFGDIATFPESLVGKQYSGPTLFVGGGQSDYLPKSDESAIKEYFPSANITYIEHVGHNAHLEDAGAFLKIVYDFYANHL